VGQASSSFDGRKLEDVRLLDADGNTHRLGDLKGRVVVLDFWATWCPPCRMSLPELGALQSKQSDLYAVVPVSLDRGGFQDVLPFFKQNPHLGLFALVPADPGALAAKVGPIRGIPTTLILDRTGKVARSWAGYAPGRLEQELLAELKRP
jgi:thiol-disulfide isomerase/thioredoxin